MNINSSKRRVFKLFFSLIFLNTFLFANIDISEKIKPNANHLSSLSLKANSFIKGSYKLSSKVLKIELLDNNKKVLKRLDKPNRLSHTFYFLTNEEKEFYIKISSNEKEVSYNLKIEKILETEYTKEENLEILSSFIKKQKEKLVKNSDTSNFWKEVQKRGTPLIEHVKGDDYIMTFLYKGAKHNVRLLGGPASDHLLLSRLENSDIWYKSFKVKKGVRLSYQVAPDVPNIKGTRREKRVAILSTAQADPLNKNPFKLSKDLGLDKFGTFSTIAILEDNFIDWTKKMNSAKGKILDTKIKSKILKDERNISIYTPSNFDSKKAHQLLFVFDGIDYQLKIPTPRILDNLIAKKEILPTVAVFIDNPSSKARATQLPPNNKKFADFLAKELLPFIKGKVKINHKAKNTILTGSSYGGLASMYVAFTYPELFGNVLSQSGSFWWGERKDGEFEWLTRTIAKALKKDLNIYLNAGLYETGYFSIDILESNRHLKTVLEAKGYKNIIYKEYPTSHDYFAWRTNIADGLISLSKFID